MSTIVESFQKRSFFPSAPLKDELPISQSQTSPPPYSTHQQQQQMAATGGVQDQKKTKMSSMLESFQKRSIKDDMIPISQQQTSPKDQQQQKQPEHEIKKTTTTTTTTSSSPIMDNIQKRSFFPSPRSLLNNKEQDLPISQSQQPNKPALPTKDQSNSLRRRLSSSSFSNLTNIQTTFSSATSSWAVFNRSKSMSSMASDEFSGISTSITKWWAWGLAWILSRKPTFATDLEMNDEESAVLGFHNRGSWRHVIYKVSSEFRRIVKGSDNGNTILDHSPI